MQLSHPDTALRLPPFQAHTPATAACVANPQQAVSECGAARQAIVPTTTLALYHAMAFAAGKVGRRPLWQRTGGRLHAWLLARQARTRARPCAFAGGGLSTAPRPCFSYILCKVTGWRPPPARGADDISGMR